jgi:hypothetical protein
LLTNVTRCPVVIVMSSGCIPLGVIDTVGGPAGTGGGAGAVVTGGVGAVGPGEAVLPLEQPVASTMRQMIRKWITASLFDAGGAAGLDEVLF